MVIEIYKGYDIHIIFYNNDDFNYTIKKYDYIVKENITTKKECYNIIDNLEGGKTIENN